MTTADAGYRAWIAAFVATVSFVAVQTLQLVGVLRFPFDETLIYATSLCIVVPFVLAMAALHHATPRERQFWTLAALMFAVIYAVFVTANYVVQLATVIPAKMRGDASALALLEQTPHSMFWDFDAIGYIAMGICTLLLVPAIDGAGFARWVRRSLIANAVVTPLIAFVYFYPDFSTALLLIGIPWIVTAPLFMLMLALHMRRMTLQGATLRT